jgi:hypothetical protein
VFGQSFAEESGKLSHENIHSRNTLVYFAGTLLANCFGIADFFSVDLADPFAFPDRGIYAGSIVQDNRRNPDVSFPDFAEKLTARALTQRSDP